MDGAMEVAKVKKKKKKGMAATADHAPQSTHTQATSFVVDLAMDKGH
jgi:hypothetical protein